jgi:hypothetical protein
MGNFVYQLGASNEATKEGKVIHRMFWHMGVANSISFRKELSHYNFQEFYPFYFRI